MGRELEVFVPGRICLMGEHSDWAGGYRRFNKDIVPGMCLVSGTNQGLYARVKAHPSKLIVSASDHKGNKFGPQELSMDPEELMRVANSESLFAYVAGVAYQVVIRYHVQGLVIDNYKTDLPVKKGLSSSAAVTVLAARAFNRVYDLKLSVRGEMDLAYQGEITTPSQCGRMDQCCAFGARPVLMRFDGDKLDCEELSLTSPLYIVIVELKGQKDTVEILQKLQKPYPVAETEVEAGVQRFLGPRNKELVEAGILALAAGDTQRMGELMDEFQADFDAALIPQCPSQLTAPNLHRVISYAPLRKHVWGAKGIGSQGDGCAQLLCKSLEDMEAAIEMVRSEFDMTCLPLQIGSSRPVTTAVIPAATFPHTLFPASKALPPALFPVLDSDGLMKPAVLLLVEQAVTAGVQKVVIVVSEQQHGAFAEIFHHKLDVTAANRLPPRMREYDNMLSEIGDKVTLVTQPVQRGLGDAVLCAQAELGIEPFLLMLGDHLYRSTHADGTSCVQQLLSSFNGTSTMALRVTAEEQIEHFGCATGRWEARRGGGTSTLSVSSLVEKPTVEYARVNLTMPRLKQGEYLTAFGLYVIAEPSALCAILSEQLEALPQGPGRAELLHLTPALDRLRQENGLLGVLLEGERYDIGGTAHSYLATLNALAPPETAD